MRGSHRGAADNSVLVLLAVVAAVIALALYVIFDTTGLEFWSVTWLVLTVIFITAIRRLPKQDQGFYYWESAGALLTVTWEVVTALAHHRGWAAGQLRFIALIGQGTRVVSLACVFIGIAIGIRSGSFRRRSSAPDAEGDTPD
jgi:hypothetical protein